MAIYERPQVAQLISRLKEEPEHLQIITGPRQTGKTTIVRQALARINLHHNYVSADSPTPDLPSTDYSQVTAPTTPFDTPKQEWLENIWKQARYESDNSDKGYVLVIDEIQKIPQWSEVVKGLWDEDRAESRPLRVVLLGSSPLLVQKGLTESLAGRYEQIRVNHWSFPEMVEAFDFTLEQYIYFGGYPGAAQHIRDQPRWREFIRSSLAQPNIERDILAMTRVDKPALLKQTFELGCMYSGQELSYNKMLGQLQDAGNATTLATYQDLLTTAGMLAGLKKYAGQQVRRRGSSPKLNVLNTAYMSVYSGYSFEEAQADRTFWGRLIESTVGAHLFNSGLPDINLYYWRDGTFEVDFVIEKSRRLIALEVKSTRRRNSTEGLAKFDKLFSTEKTMLIGGTGIPLEEFLYQPAAHWFDST